MLVWFIALRRSLAVQKSRKHFFFQRFALGMFTSEPKHQHNGDSTLHTDTDN